MERLHLLIVLAFALAQQAQAAELSSVERDALMAEAKLVSDATLRGDMATVVAATHPAVVRAGGGKERLVELAQRAFSQMSAQGLEPIKLETSEPDCRFSVPAHRLCFLPKTSTVRMAGKVVKEHSFLVAVRDKQTLGRWMFIDGAAERRNPGVIRALLPWLPASAVFPPNFVQPTE